MSDVEVYMIANLLVKDASAYRKYEKGFFPILKKFGGEFVIPGNIIIRQRGTKYHPGENVGIGKDHTIFATVGGHVKFKQKAKGRMFVGVELPS